MNDIRKIAAERAAKTRTAPVGTSFESERQRAKSALVRQLDFLDGKNIRKIAALSDTAAKEDKVLRVAAYCRVSTDDIDQAISITFQIREYKRKILSNPGWKYAGTYVDDGFSGTNTDHRQGFQKLMKDAMDGKIDMIITKAVSRFARNLMDCIGWVEALQNHDPPVRVFFEQENLDTMSQTSGIILFVLAMVAQEESHMKSEAILLSLEWRFSRGRFLTPRLFGYDKIDVPDGFGGYKKILSINETEGRVVKWMYATLLNGGTPEEMAQVLTDLAIPTGGRTKDGALNTHWTKYSVTSCLRNEKHCGDVLARKTYTPNYKDHKAKKNKGKKNKYFQPDHHDAIVSRAVWNAAQKILNSRKYGHGGSYLPILIIDHGALAGYISMNRSWAGFDLEDYRRASQIAMGILEENLEMDLEKTYLPEGGQKIGGLMDDHGIAQIARDLTEAEQEIKDELEGKNGEGETSKRNDREERTFQVVSGDMFSRVSEPLVRITKSYFSFSKSCVEKLKAGTAEILFNPVERMLIVRACSADHPNAILWKKREISATALCGILYDAMGWDRDYSFKIPCQKITDQVLAFDLDQYIGQCKAKKEEAVIPIQEEIPKEEAKSFFYPPDDDEPLEIRELEEKIEKAIEKNRKHFGEPAFQYRGGFRSMEGLTEEDLMMEAVPMDKNHQLESTDIDDLLLAIIDDPPLIRNVKSSAVTVVDAEQ